MYAVDDLSDAVDVTREFLTPVQLKTWLKLVVVVFFISGIGFSGPSFPFADGGTVVDDPGAPQLESELDVAPEDVLLLVAALVVLSVLVWLLFTFVGSFMEFVFYESLRSGDVHVRRYARRNAGRALQLFGFRLVGALVPGVLVGVPALYILLVRGMSTATAATLVVVGLLAIPLYLLYAVVMRFTTVFVAPIMLLEERGILGAWRRFWPTFAGNWTEYVVYLVLVWIVWLAAGIAISFLAAFAFVVVAIPFGILAFVLFSLGSVGIALAALVVLFALALFFLFMAVLEVPVYTYLRYYALLILGDTEGELDLIPEQRAAVSGDGGNGPDAEPEGFGEDLGREDSWESTTEDWGTSDWDTADRDRDRDRDRERDSSDDGDDQEGMR